ncbi:MAG TPA: energy transducer TonB [Gemmatimonadaceae bacterium]|nr:energy transducer TonB [Gemmatimonadaceae bacterium]
MRLPFIAALLAVVLCVDSCAVNPTAKPGVSSSRRAVAACLDTLRATDSISKVVKMSIESLDTNTALPPDFEGLLIEEFRHAFKAPSHLLLSVVMGTPPCDSLGGRCMGASLNLAAVAYATAHNDGRLSDIAVVDASLTPTLADSIASALQTVSKARGGPPTGEVESIHLMMQIGPEENLDTVPALQRILVAKMPRYELPFRYATMPATGINPSYPFKARLAGVGDSVTIAFTVEPDGAVASESMELVHANYRDFVSSVLEALGNTRYHPAYLGDCPVATRMTQRFMFRLPD